VQDDCDGRSSERLRRPILDICRTREQLERCRQAGYRRTNLPGACIGAAYRSDSPAAIALCRCRRVLFSVKGRSKWVDRGPLVCIRFSACKAVPDGDSAWNWLTPAGARSRRSKPRFGMVNKVYQTPEGPGRAGVADPAAPWPRSRRCRSAHKEMLTLLAATYSGGSNKVVPAQRRQPHASGALLWCVVTTRWRVARRH